MPKQNNYIYFAVGLLFALVFVGADLKIAKADYVTMIDGKPAEVRYNESTKLLDVYYVGETEPLATGVSFTQDESTNNRGVLNMEDLEAKSKGAISKDTEIKAPEREEQTGITDSSEEADDYSCLQVGVCGTTVIGYNSDPNDPNYALYSNTNAREIVTVFLRDSGQAQGNNAWNQAPGEISESGVFGLEDDKGIKLIDKTTLTSEEANAILKELGADFRVAGDIENVSRQDLLKALQSDFDEDEEEVVSGGEEEEEKIPKSPFVPTADCAFLATPTEILYSKSSNLQWNCNIVDGCSIKDEFNTVVQSSLPTMSGGVKVTPLKTTRYYLSCPQDKTWEAMVRVFSSGIQ